MVRVAGINENDMVNGEGVSVSLFLQGCPLRCKGCHNPETWDKNGGVAWEDNMLINHILDLIAANGIQRNLSILGGEPLDTYEKRYFLKLLIRAVKQKYPDIVICLWTGFLYNNAVDLAGDIISQVDYLIEGPFILSQRDVTLKWRGSRNQHIIDIKNNKLIED